MRQLLRSRASGCNTSTTSSAGDQNLAKSPILETGYTQLGGGHEQTLHCNQYTIARKSDYSADCVRKSIGHWERRKKEEGFFQRKTSEPRQREVCDKRTQED